MTTIANSKLGTSTDIPASIEAQRDFFATGETKDYEYRVEQLNKLLRLIKEHDQLIMSAVRADLRKPDIEIFGSEILVTLSDIKYVLKHLKAWMKPQKVKTPVNLFPSSSYIYNDPLGVVLIVAPWNYPFGLTISPLIGAIAAGNCAILKPSEHTPHTSKAIAEMINNNFDPSYIKVIEGGIETNQALLAEKFDHIFFTGGTAIGKIVMAAAAQHLTPVTLELGGKSPCIIDTDCDLDLTAKRIVWGKFYNAGQTCVAPDYLLVPKSIKSALVDKLRAYVTTFFGENPQQSLDFGRIVNERQFDRLANLLASSAPDSKILVGGQSDRGDRFIAPTIVDQVEPSSPLMAEEIFGPILPILEYDQITEAIAFINSQPKPLALYLFSNNKKMQEQIAKDVAYGGGCFNDIIMHLGNPELPFGGVGNSGMGAYHGKASFDTFSHRKSVLKNSFKFDLKWRYPPYNLDLNRVKKFLG